MELQKICIIGDGLAALSAAVILGQENIEIDLYIGSNKKNKLNDDNRTTAVSESRYQFIKKKININNKKIFWPCKEIELFYEDNKIINNFLNFKEKKKNLMYIFKNKELKKNLLKQIVKKKNITFKKKYIDGIDYTDGNVLLDKKKINYDLIILCIGSQSKLYNNITYGREIEKNYKEMALTAIVEHNSKIEKVSQFFLKEGPLAILPFNKKMFSIVWSVSNIFYQKNNESIKEILHKKIQLIFNNIKINNINNIRSFPITLNLKTK